MMGTPKIPSSLGRFAVMLANSNPFGKRWGRIAMIIVNQDDVTSDALAAMERTADPRVREILVSLVKHLHGFICEVRLTEDEFRQAAAVLIEMGELSTDTH